MEVDKAYNPMQVGFLGADGVMLAAHNQADLVEEFGGSVNWLNRYYNGPLIEQMFFLTRAIIVQRF